MKVLKALLCILLGIVIGIGAVAGCIAAVLLINLDTIFGLVGVENKDESDEYVYVNTEEITNVVGALSYLITFVSEPGTYTLRTLETTFPIFKGVIEGDDDSDGIIGQIEEATGTAMDRDGFLDTPINELGTFLGEYINSIEVYKLLSGYVDVGDDTMGALIRAVLLGKESDYYTGDDKIDHAVFYLPYKLSDLDQFLEPEKAPEADGDEAEEDEENKENEENKEDEENEEEGALPAGVTAYADDEEDEAERSAVQDEDDSNLYFYKSGDEFYHLIKQGTSYIEAERIYIPEKYENLMYCTGDWYKEFHSSSTQDYDVVVISPMTLGGLATDTLTENIYSVSILDMMDNLSTNAFAKILDGYTIGDLVNGNIDINGINIAELLSVSPGSDEMMASILYNISGIYQSEDGDWRCTYTDESGISHECYIDTDPDTGYISDIYYVTGGDIIYVTGVTVGNMSEAVSDLKLSVVLSNVEVTNAIMMYVVYGVYDIFEGNDGYWYGYARYLEGDGSEKQVRIQVSPDTSIVQNITYTDDESLAFTGTSVSSISSTIGNIQEDLVISSLLGDISTDNAIMAYLCYSIAGIKQDGSGQWYATYHTGTLDENNEEITYRVNLDVRQEGEGDAAVYYITGMQYAEGADEAADRLRGTAINGISGQVTGLMDNLTLGEIINIDSSNKILYALKNSTISGLSTYLNMLSLQELYPDSIYEGTWTQFAYLDGNSVKYIADHSSADIASYAIYYFEKIDQTQGDDGLGIEGTYKILTYNDASVTDETTLIRALQEHSVNEAYIKTSTIREAILSTDERYNGDTYYYYDENALGYVVNEYIAYDPDYLYWVKDEDGMYTLVDGYYGEHQDRVDYTSLSDYGHLTKEQFEQGVAQGVTYYTYGPATGIWKLMFCNMTGDSEITQSGESIYMETAYGINDIGQIASNVVGNLKVATMYDLKEIGILSSSDATLNTLVTIGDVSTTLGTLTVDGVLSYLSEIMSMLTG